MLAKDCNGCKTQNRIVLPRESNQPLLLRKPDNQTYTFQLADRRVDTDEAGSRAPGMPSLAFLVQAWQRAFEVARPVQSIPYDLPRGRIRSHSPC